MRCAFLFLCSALLAMTGVAQTRPFSADFPPGGKLRLHLRSGEISIIGADQNRISVEVSGKKANEARDLQVRLKKKDGATDLRISGGSRKDVTLTIRVPRNTDLYARIPFGDVRVENVAGNKDIELHAGELTVSVGSSADYAHVDASIVSGELDGEPFGESHGGLFRSFRKEGSGKYRLHAHVGAGQLTLQ
jgi:hypothetical protein